MRVLSVILVTFLLTACASRPLSTVSPPPPPPPPGGVSLEGGIPPVENAQVARAYLVAGEPYRPFRDNLPFGLILLKSGDTNRNNAVCSAFVNGIPSVVDSLQVDPNAAIILTYWLLKKPLSDTDLVNCEALLENYDFSRAAKLRNSYGRASASGPVFLGLQLNAGLLNPDNSPMKPYVAILDLSAQAPTDAGITTMTWFDQVVTSAEDMAGQPAYVSEEVKRRKKGRGWFGKLVNIAKTVVTGLACDVLKTDATSPTLGVSQLAVFDPEYKLVVGTVRLFTQGSKVVGFASNLLADLFCPALAWRTDGQEPRQLAIAQDVRRREDVEVVAA